MSRAEDITEFNPVRDAFVPIIKMEYRGVSIDLIFASLPTMTQISKDLETIDKSMLRNLDDTAMRSVNGTRVTKELLQSVPQVKSFRHALRAIKLWSNRTSCRSTYRLKLTRKQSAPSTELSLATPAALHGPSWSLASASSTPLHAARPFSPNSSV